MSLDPREASPGPGEATSSLQERRVVLASPGDGLCLWCLKPRPATAVRWCSKKCRQTAWRFRKEGVVRTGEDDNPLRLAYADPPYPGCAKRYYGKEATFKGEVDHEVLLAELITYDGWALSTSRKALRDILALCPPDAIPCPFIKTKGAPISRGPGNIHEYVIVVPGRYRQPGPPDAFVGGVPRQEGAYLMGRKSISFANWIFQLLGASPVDRLHDLYPGTGIIEKCWKEFCRAGRRLELEEAPSRIDRAETPPGSTGDVVQGRRDATKEVL